MESVNAMLDLMETLAKSKLALLIVQEKETVLMEFAHAIMDGKEMIVLQKLINALSTVMVKEPA